MKTAGGTGTASEMPASASYPIPERRPGRFSVPSNTKQMTHTNTGRLARLLSVAGILIGIATIGGSGLLAQTTPAPQPSICGRSCWNATSNSLPPTSGLNRAVIHHTAGPGLEPWLVFDRSAPGWNGRCPRRLFPRSQPRRCRRSQRQRSAS